MRRLCLIQGLQDTAVMIRSSALCPRSRLRQAMMVVALFSATASVVSKPKPLFAPVTTITFPPRSGILSLVQFFTML
jgi:hypothetical protein